MHCQQLHVRCRDSGFCEQLLMIVLEYYHQRSKVETVDKLHWVPTEWEVLSSRPAQNRVCMKIT